MSPAKDHFHGVLRAVVTVHPDAEAVRVAIRAGLTLAIPLIALTATGRDDLTLYPTFGAFAAVYGRGSVPLRRIITRLQAGTWLTVAVTLGATVAISPNRSWLAIPAAAVVAMLGTLASYALEWRPPGALFAVFAVAACASVPTSASRIPVAFGLSLATVALAVMLDVPAALPRLATQTPPRAMSGSSRQAISASAVTSATVCAIAVACAGLLATGVTSSRPYWAMVAAVAATAGPTATARVARGIQRVLGTGLGLIVASVILAADPSVGVVVAVAIAAQMGAELLVGRNYALALVFITPLALLMVDLAHPQPTRTLLHDRLVETVIGAACGIGITLAAHVIGRLRTRREAA